MTLVLEGARSMALAAILINYGVPNRFKMAAVQGGLVGIIRAPRIKVPNIHLWRVIDEKAPRMRSKSTVIATASRNRNPSPSGEMPSGLWVCSKPGRGSRAEYRGPTPVRRQS